MDRQLRILALSIFLLLGFNAFGQNDASKIRLRFDALGIDDGLSQGMINCICQSRNGYMWFVTKDGLNRYDGYNFKVYRHDINNPHSIASNELIKIKEDSKGRLWISTANNGVDIFDQDLETFTHLTDLLPGLNKLKLNEIQYIEEDIEGGIWILNLNNNIHSGRLSFNSRDGQAKKGNLKYEDLIPYISNNYDIDIKGWEDIRLMPSRNGIYIGHNEEIYFLKNKKATHIFSIKNSNIPSNGNPIRVSSFVFDTSHHIIYFLLDLGYVVKYNEITHNIEKIKIFDFAINGAVDKEGNLWLSTWEFCLRINYGTTKVNTVELNKSPFHPSSGMGSMYLYSDRSGIMWCGTPGYGLLKFNVQSEKFHFILPPSNINPSIQQIGVFPDGQLAITCMNYSPHPNTFCLDSQNLHFKKFFLTEKDHEIIAKFTSKDHYVPINDILALDTSGFYWMGTWIGAVIAYNPLTKQVKVYNPLQENWNTKSYLIYLDSKNRIWVGCGNTISMLNTESGKYEKIIHHTTQNTASATPCLITAIIEEGDSIFWLGTRTGLLRVNIDSGKTKEYSNVPGNASSLNANSVYSLCKDPMNPEKYMWVGTSGGGINKMDKQTGKFTAYTTRDGLPNDVAYGILSDNRGRLWISTNRGLSCFDPVKKTFKNFLKENGLQGNEFNRRSYIKLKNGDLIFGGTEGITIFNPDEIRTNEIPPNIVFTDLKIMNKPAAFHEKESPLSHTLRSGDTIKLPWNKNIISFQYSALDYTSPKANRYKYKMKGIDNDWVEAGSRREASYTNLAPGEYTFFVMGTNSDGVWSVKPAIVTLIITPPWWSSWLARSIYLVLAVGGIFGFISYRTRNLKKKTIELESKVNERTTDLQEAVHRLNESQEQIMNQKDALEEANNIKTKLFSIVSHDMRSPLNSLDAALKILRAGGELTREELKAIAERFDFSIQSTMNLLDNLLSWSLIQMQKMRLNPSQVSIEEVVDENIEIYGNVAFQKNITLVPQIEANLSAFADINIVRLIIRNLINNAIKFSFPGSEVLISGHYENQNVIISIKDYGTGMTPEQAANLFNSQFKSKPAAGTAREKGTGLGLSICYEVIQKSGGQISVESEVDKGSTFKVTLPAFKVG